MAAAYMAVTHIKCCPEAYQRCVPIQGLRRCSSFVGQLCPIRCNRAVPIQRVLQKRQIKAPFISWIWTLDQMGLLYTKMRWGPTIGSFSNETWAEVKTVNETAWHLPQTGLFHLLLLFTDFLVHKGQGLCRRCGQDPLKAPSPELRHSTTCSTGCEETVFVRFDFDGQKVCPVPPSKCCQWALSHMDVKIHPDGFGKHNFAVSG